MTNRTLEVIIKLRDDLSKNLDAVSAKVNKFGAELGKLGTFLRTTGREISMIGNNMAAFGASITAPLLVAYAAAGDYSFSVHKSITDLKNSFSQLSVSIGTSLAPIMQNFANIVQNLVDKWNALSPQVRDHIIQTTYLAGQYLVVGGAALVAFGKIIAVIGTTLRLIKQDLIPAIISVFKTIQALIAGDPFTWIIVAIGAIIMAMWKWKGVADAILDTMTLMVKAASAVGLAMMGNWKGAAIAAKEFSNTIKDVIGGKHTQLANAFDGFKKKTGEWIDKIQDVGSGLGQIMDLTSGLDTQYTKAHQTVGTFWDGFKMALYDSANNLKFFVDTGKQAATDMMASIQTSFKTFFVDVFHGQLKRASDYFTEFGNKLLDIFANVISQMITQWITAQIIMGFASAATGGVAGAAGGGAFAASDFGSFAPIKFHQGGRVRKAHSGMLASDEVPIIAQLGEGVISRKGMAALGQGNFDALNRGESVGGSGGGVNIYLTQVVQAWDSKDVQRNKAALAKGLIDELKRNGEFRTAIKDYSR